MLIAEVLESFLKKGDCFCLLSDIHYSGLIFAAGPKDTPMDLVMEKTYDVKTGKGMPDL